MFTVATQDYSLKQMNKPMTIKQENKLMNAILKTELSRSVIHESVELAKKTFAQFGIHLPPFAYWSTNDWKTKGEEVAEIRDCMLGWDVTDFGSGRFKQIGRILFTLRNGTSRTAGYSKVYAEKLLLDPEGQRAPAHFHLAKMEDISCRAGGNILVQLQKTNPDNSPSNEKLIATVDGEKIEIEARGIIQLKPGMSINIPPRTIHQFWGEEGTGMTVSSEVSSVCDDWSDNFFLEPAERFPKINEDEPKRIYLCHEYPKSFKA
jgi:hypothetical protein